MTYKGWYAIKQRNQTKPTRVWHKTISGGEAYLLGVCSVLSIPLLPLLPGPFWPSFGVTVNISFKGQIDVIENHLQYGYPMI